MAGSTASGFAASRADLFRGRPFLVVPTARSDAAAMATAGDIARAAGGHVTVVSAEVHDRAMAVLSALPLAVAAAMMAAAHESEPALAGPGFRDVTRLAATPEDLAVELLAANADAAASAMAALVTELDRIGRTLRSGDRAALAAYLRAPRAARRALDEA
jgi:prephenate dehydrogenase